MHYSVALLQDKLQMAKSRVNQPAEELEAMCAQKASGSHCIALYLGDSHQTCSNMCQTKRFAAHDGA